MKTNRSLVLLFKKNPKKINQPKLTLSYSSDSLSFNCSYFQQSEIGNKFCFLVRSSTKQKIYVIYFGCLLVNDWSKEPLNDLGCQVKFQLPILRRLVEEKFAKSLLTVAPPWDFVATCIEPWAFWLLTL